jgi:hypothetical protein
MWVAIRRTTISALGIRNANHLLQQDSVTAALGSYLHKQLLRATYFWQTHRVRCGLFCQSHGPDVRNMPPLPRRSFAINLPILVLFLLLAHSHLVLAKTIIHFYAHTSCNAGRHWSAIYWRRNSCRDMSVCAQFNCRALC